MRSPGSGRDTGQRIEGEKADTASGEGTDSAAPLAASTESVRMAPQFHLAESSRPCHLGAGAECGCTCASPTPVIGGSRNHHAGQESPWGGSEMSDHRHASSSWQQKPRPVLANQNRARDLQGPEERAAIARVLPANRHDLHAVRQLEVHKPSGALSRSQLAAAADRRLKRLTGRVV